MILQHHNQRDIILLITHSSDYFTIDRVAQAVLKRGAQPFRLDTDKFPIEVQLKAHLSKFGNTHTLKYGDNSITSQQVKGVWMRRIWHPQFSKLAPQFEAACVRESIATLQGFWDSLKHARWVDDLQRINAVENKLYQLRIAQEVGLTIPETIVTNAPEQAQKFFHKLKGKMVAKLLTPLSYSMESLYEFLYTSLVKEEDLLDAEALRYCPMVFQEQIPKQRELRVIYVNGKLFVGALDASKYEKITVDWRRVNPNTCVWEPHELPAEISLRLNSFMARVGLTFGAFDFIQTPSGEYVFLEINPVGEWGMLERDLNYAISDAIAEALVSTTSSTNSKIGYFANV
ncbi:MvdC family ATP-grasp ribosomal peptide maturase [Calothrix sp. HK-06]|nr:MvdC family ATP-grasp ribosomal peptide maturase [Calothrix sp. HK-06]